MSSIMTVLGLSCLTSWFSALLPTDSDDDPEYYAVLGLERNASLEDIRKAYKQKSLELHPDKVAQRGGNAEQAAAQYVHVQEANAVLSHAKKRKLYHAVGCSPAKYKFISTGAWHNPTALHDNLSHASMAAKSRIVFVMALLLVLLLLQPLLIVVKINQILSQDGGALQDTPWIVILIPWWVTHGLYVALWLVMFVASLKSENDHSHTIFVTLLEQISWLTWEVLLALRWDRTINWDYVYIFVPFYLVLALRCYHALVTMLRIRNECTKMVSLEYINGTVLQDGKHYDDLSPQERQDLHKNFILVHHDDDIEPLLVGLQDEEDLEEAKVHASVEFRNKMETYYHALSKFIHTVFYWTPFCILTVLKLDDHISVSWWVVFIPLLVFLGYNVVSNCLVCCCGTVAGDEIVIASRDNEEEEEETEEEHGEEEQDVKEEPRNNVNASMTAFAPADGDMDQFSVSVHSEADSVELQALEEPSHAIPDSVKLTAPGDDEDTDDDEEDTLLEPLPPAEETNKAAGSTTEETNKAVDSTTDTTDEKTETPTDPTAITEQDDMEEEPKESDQGDTPAEDPMSITEEDDMQEEDEAAVEDATPNGESGANVEENDKPDPHVEGNDKPDATVEGDDKPDTNVEENDKPDAADANGQQNGELQDVVNLYSPKNDSPKAREFPNGEHPSDEDEENGDDDDVGIDPETFEAWQSAYQEAESSASEEQIKAQGSCCWASLQLMILCLFVGKLDQSYEASVDNGDDVGYNAVWIIFPILLLAGLALLCCACVVYGSRPKEEDAATNDEDQEPQVPVVSSGAETKHEENNGTMTTTPPTEKEDQTKPDEEEAAAGGYDADDID